MIVVSIPEGEGGGGGVKVGAGGIVVGFTCVTSIVVWQEVSMQEGWVKVPDSVPLKQLLTCLRDGQLKQGPMLEL